MLLELRIRKPIHTKEYENDTEKKIQILSLIEYLEIKQLASVTKKTQIPKHSDCLATKNTNLKSIS